MGNSVNVVPIPVAKESSDNAMATTKTSTHEWNQNDRDPLLAVLLTLAIYLQLSMVAQWILVFLFALLPIGIVPKDQWR